MTTKRLLWAMLVSFVLSIGISASAILYADRAVKRSEQTHCIVYNLIHRGQLAEPPTTDAGKEFAEVVQAIRQRFDCKEEK